MNDSERLDKIEEKLDKLNEKVIKITIWETIGKLAMGGLSGIVLTEIVHYLGILKP